MRLRKLRGFTLVELMIVVAIIGVLAAIAIPAFRRYIKSTRTAEAESILEKMSRGSASYFTSEQKFSDPGAGDQPWHFGTTTQSQINTNGMPVPFSQNVFPGGIDAAFNTTDGFGPYVDCNTAPDGGAKNLANLPPVPRLVAILNKMKVRIEDPIYFQYAYQSTGSGFGAEARLAAAADWSDGGPCHIIEGQITVNATSGDVRIGPRSTTNEYE